MNSLIKYADYTPDPKTALNILKDFSENNPSISEGLSQEQCHALAMLSAYSNFLSRYSINNPSAFLDEFNNINTQINEDLNCINLEIHDDINPIIRTIKKRILLKITLRFILNITTIIESMDELSALADKLIELTFNHIKKQLVFKHGRPNNDGVTIISLGKLGARELNYSSDIDLICVYRDNQGETSGRVSSLGNIVDRISNQEFYCKLVEILTKTLSKETEDGFVYRVDLRLRPYGQKGWLALSLSGYELYYESIGREWERLALIRARYAAGDKELFNDFINVITHFVYRKYIDMSSINEIRNLKQLIDNTSSDRDIKRGMGGIREIEFFVQTFQLIYGGQNKLLRGKNLLNTIRILSEINIIGRTDYDILTENYTYLRHLEQIIQMEDDLQTHKLPTDPQSLSAIAKKMRYEDRESFYKDLEKRRYTVRHTYDSLFAISQTEKIDKPIRIFDGELTLEGLSRYIVNKNIKISKNIIDYTKKIKEGLTRGEPCQTLRGRRLKENILPEFTELALGSINPEIALKNLLLFSDILVTNASYLDLFHGRNELSKALIDVFSQSDYLSKILIKNPRYIDTLSGGAPIRKTFKRLITDLLEDLFEKKSIDAYSETINIFKRMEELRLGILFLNKKITVLHLIKGLSKVSDAILNGLFQVICPNEDLIIAGFGKFGGREITINSDLDLTFISISEPSENTTITAQKILNILTFYSNEGISYDVDIRLRPEGTKGMLVNGLSGLRQYYLNNAQMWEIQALLKARPVAGKNGSQLISLTKEIINKRGHEITAEYITAMRNKIKKEHLDTSFSFDLKLGDGGIEDIEFLVQYLQLKNNIIVQNTIAGIVRLQRHGIIDYQTRDTLINNYLFQRTVESFIRLSEQGKKTTTNVRVQRRRPESALIDALCMFFNYDDKDIFLAYLDKIFETNKEIIHRLLK